MKKNMKVISLEEKIKIIIKFAKTGEVIKGSTVFEGYPIGKWAIAIRLEYNTSLKENGNQKNGTIKEYEEELKGLGILENKRGVPEDEKIDALVRWMEKYPNLKLSSMASVSDIGEYAKDEKELEKIQEEYAKVKGYYDYLRVRKSKNKLDSEQIKKCKEGNVGGVFGYSTEIEELAKKYNVEDKDMYYIINKYESIDNFYEMYKRELIHHGDYELQAKIIKNVFDIDESQNKGFDSLYRCLAIITTHCSDLNFYSSKRLIESMDCLTERERKVIESRFGLKDNKSKTLGKTAKILNVTKERIRQIEAKSLRKLRKYNKYVNAEIITKRDEESVEISDKIAEIEKDLQLQIGDQRENIEKLKAIEGIIVDIEEKKMQNDYMVREIEERMMFLKDILELDRPIKELSTSMMGYMITKEVSYEDLVKYGLREDLASEVMQKLKEDAINLKDDYEYSIRGKEGYLKSVGIDEKTIKTISKSAILNTGIDEIELTVRSYNGLKRLGLNTIRDVIDKTPEEILHIRNLGKKSYDEIVEKLKELGVSLKGEPEPETELDYEEEEPEIITNQMDGDNKEIVITENQEENKEDVKDEGHEKSNLENMTLEELKDLDNKYQEIINQNDEIIKQETIKRILEKQGILKEQEETIEKLRNENKRGE